MVDVLHYLFEEDNHYVSEESAKSRSGIRVAMYRDMYNTTYKYEYKSAPTSGHHSAATYSSGEDLEYMTEAEEIKAFGPDSAGPDKPPMKPPAQPPTEFDPYSPNPFAGILDAPMN